MKRKLCLLFTVLLSVFFICTVSAAPPVLDDNADFLSPSEEAEISKLLKEIRIEYNFDVSIVTEDTFSDYSAQARADNLYDYNGYGLGAESSGMLLYISKSPREYALTTHGQALTLFDDDNLEYIEDEILPYLRNDDYYGAFSAFAEASDELLRYGSSNTVKTDKNFVIMILILLLLPLIIAFALTHAKERQAHTARSNNFADNYIKSGIDLKYSKDFFLYSTVTKTRKAKTNSNTHTSASGRTHGGRSGSY